MEGVFLVDVGFLYSVCCGGLVCVMQLQGQVFEEIVQQLVVIFVVVFVFGLVEQCVQFWFGYWQFGGGEDCVYVYVFQFECYLQFFQYDVVGDVFFWWVWWMVFVVVVVEDYQFVEEMCQYGVVVGLVIWVVFVQQYCLYVFFFQQVGWVGQFDDFYYFGVVEVEYVVDGVQGVVVQYGGG